MCFVMLSGHYPFTAMDRDEYYTTEIAEAKFDHDVWTPVSDEAKSFIKRLLVYAPAKRMTAADSFSHPWIKAAEAYCKAVEEGKEKKNAPKVRRSVSGDQLAELCAAGNLLKARKSLRKSLSKVDESVPLAGATAEE